MSVLIRRPRADAAIWPRLPTAFVTVIAGLVLVAGLGGYAARSLTAPAERAPEGAATVDLGGVAVSVPSDWSRAAPRKGDPDLGARSAWFAPVEGLSNRAAIALAPFGDPSLVPAALRPLTAAGGPRPGRVAGLRAWTYPESAMPGGRIAKVTVVPTSSGILAVACIAPRASWGIASACTADISRVAFEGARALLPSETLTFRRALEPALERLNARRATLRARLRAATTRRGQVRFATRLGRAHVRAAAALAPQVVTPETRQVVRILRGAEAAYGRLAIAARNGWPVRFRRARAAVQRHDVALRRAVAAVR